MERTARAGYIPQVRVRTVRRRARLLYLPAYVADYNFGEAFNAHGERRPQRFKAVVSGLDASRIAAERHFSPHKVWPPPFEQCLRATRLNATSLAYKALQSHLSNIVRVQGMAHSEPFF